MRILIVIMDDGTGVAGMGGAERQAILLANEMIKNHNEVLVLCVADKKGIATDFMDSLSIPYKLYKNRILKRFVNNINCIGIARTVNKFKPQMVLSYTTPANIYTGIASFFVSGNVKFVWGQRDAGLNFKCNKIIDLIRNRFAKYVSNSTEGAQYMVQEFKFPEEKIDIIYNGITIPKITGDKKYRTMYNIAPNDTVCTMVANLHGNKDHYTLIKSWGIVTNYLAKQGKKGYLLLAGRQDEMYDTLMELTKQLKLTESVKFLGAISDVSQLLSESDIMVHSSPSEGISNAILEAMAIGLPVIATDISGNKECLGSDAQPETLTPVGDSDAMAEKLLKLIQHPQLCEQIKKSNIDRIHNTFSLESLYNNYIRIATNEITKN